MRSTSKSSSTPLPQNWATKSPRYPPSITESGINKIFDLFDDDGTGFINVNNIKRVAKELGETMSQEELIEMLERASSNNKEISREDFYNIMTKKTF